MCFTVDQINRACGLLLLNEFNSFIYCCKQCTCEYESGSSLEVHILSEHQDDKEIVFGNGGVFVDNIEPAPVEYDPTNIKIEQFGPNTYDLDESNIEEQVVDEVKPLTVFTLNENIDNGNNSTETNTPNNMFLEVKPGETNESEKRHVSDENIGHYLLESTQQFPITKRRGRPPGAKNTKNISDKPVKKLVKKAINDAATESNTLNKNPISKEKFHCDMCPDVSVKHKQSLIKHMNTFHTPLWKKKRCEICNKMPRQSYERHMRTYHSDHRYKCDFCDATFKHNASRVIHMRTHTLEKPFLCSTCGKAFNSRSQCYAHEVSVHRMVRKHQCSYCDKSFSHPYNLKDHENAIHTKKRPHVCEICSKDFATKSTLRFHKAIHSEAKVKCRYCDALFTVRGSRWRHEMVYHKKVVMVGDKIMNMYKKSDRMKMKRIEEEAARQQKEIENSRDSME